MKAQDDIQYLGHSRKNIKTRVLFNERNTHDYETAEWQSLIVPWQSLGSKAECTRVVDL